MASKPPRQLSFVQCLVGGGVGFGVLSAIFCVLTGGTWAVWLFLTIVLTAGYTGYYYIRTGPPRPMSNDDEST